VVAAGFLAVMACNVRADNVRAEDLKAPADSTASPSSEPAVEAVSTRPEASVEPETEAEPAALAHRYARIPKRNAFGIKPPPAAPPPPEPEKEPPKDRPEFFLTGFTSIRGEKRAFVAYQPKGKPIQYPRALILEDEVNVADGVLKLVSIDSIEKTVLIAFNGEDIPLNFKDNAVKVPGSGGAPGGAAPGAPGLPPSALRGNQPPPAIMNQPGNNAGAMNGAFFSRGGSGRPDAHGHRAGWGCPEWWRRIRHAASHSHERHSGGWDGGPWRHRGAVDITVSGSIGRNSASQPFSPAQHPAPSIPRPVIQPYLKRVG